MDLNPWSQFIKLAIMACLDQCGKPGCFYYVECL